MGILGRLQFFFLLLTLSHLLNRYSHKKASKPVLDENDMSEIAFRPFFDLFQLYLTAVNHGCFRTLLYIIYDPVDLPYFRN